MKKIFFILGFSSLIIGCSINEKDGSNGIVEETKDGYLNYSKLSRPCAYENANIENINEEEIYNFRDNGLLKSSKGQNYVEYYYQLSEYAISNDLLISNNSSELFTLLYEGAEIVKKLLDSNFTGELINEDVYQKCLVAVGVFQSTENYNKIQTIVEILKIDLELMKNKNATEVRAFLGINN